MSKFFEIVVFTAGLQDYADWVLNELDWTKKKISHRLYRNNCSNIGGFLLKDLQLLGRDLKKTIIVDDRAQNFTL
jgi:TFIIF-interacting CTD phosphatase-like protein